MADIASKDPMPHQWLLFEIADDQRVGIWGDSPMSLDGLLRLQALVKAQVDQMKKGPVAP